MQFVEEEKDKGDSYVKMTDLEDDPNGPEQTSSETKPKHESSYVTRTKSRMVIILMFEMICIGHLLHTNPCHGRNFSVVSASSAPV